MANEIEIKVPDIGSSAHVDVIEVLVKVGDEISKDTSLITLETDKASMEIPSPIAGKVTKISVKVGDKVAEGDVILFAEVESIDAKAEHQDADEPRESAQEHQSMPPLVAVADTSEHELSASANTSTLASDAATTSAPVIDSSGVLFAGPAVRRMARELGITLSQVKGSGRKDRITKDDLQIYVKERLSASSATGGFNVPVIPAIDFTKFGEIESKPLSKIKKATGINVHRSWISIPHVTHFDETDITELELFRKSEAEHANKAGYKLTVLAFVCAVISKALRVYPQFNASLDASGDHLIYKKYCNIGIAVETPNGLVVPVIRNTDKLTVSEIALEMARLSQKAREKNLMPADMSGGCFTISSLGGIGGTAFTPIVNSPEVAILGLSRAVIKPVYIKEELKPRLILPLSLSYDHRVIDGAEAARFTRFISESLSDIRRILL
ncbi:MAG: dihydrolipoyllysine-residue acetyltransferase [Legionellales bacterium]